MMSSFSYMGWSLTCVFLGKCLFRSLPFFKSDYLSFCYWVVGVPYIFFMLIVSQIYVLQTFSPILDVAFPFYPWLPDVKWINGKESACQSGNMDSIHRSGKSPGEVNSNPLQYSCLEIPWIKEPGGIWPMGSPRVRLDSGTK